MSLIDLDQPARRATDREGRPPLRWLLAGVAVAALLIGAVLGGLVTRHWNAEQARAADGRKVSVLLFANPLARGAVNDIVNGDGIVQVTFLAAIVVVNAGPRPVEIQSLAAQKAGMTVAGSARSHWISPGTSFPVEVDITANCIVHQTNGGIAATIGGGVMQATASVHTTSGSVTTVSSLNFDPRGWTTQFQAAVDKCRGLAAAQH